MLIKTRMLLVENSVNQVSSEELENDHIEVFQEDSDAIKRDIAELQQWLKETPHMRQTRDDEVFLRFFLRGCNYSVADTKSKLDLYFTARYWLF